MPRTIGGAPLQIRKPSGPTTVRCGRCGTGTVTTYEVLARDEGWRCSNRACRQEYDLTREQLLRLKYQGMNPAEILRAKALEC